MPDQFKSSQYIDLTSMAYVNSCLHKRFVQGIIHVKDAELGYVGDLCFNEDGGIEFFQKLLSENEIEFWQTNDQSTIPDTNCVHVILAQPYYLVKDLKKPYR